LRAGSWLAKLNGKSQVDLPGVGQNLQDHPIVPIAHQIVQDVHPAITSNGIAEAALFLHSENNLNAAPDLNFFSCPIFLAPPNYVPAGAGFVGLVCLTHPESRGSVSLRSPDPQAAPSILMNYLKSNSDLQKIIIGVKLIRKLFQTTAFDEFRGEEVAPGANIQSDEAIESHVRESCTTLYHPVGTCKMGIDSMAVVDPELRVHGIVGLRVVDASIMPTLTTGNTNAPTIAIGEKAADLIKATSDVSQI
jgi:choline dehydrogenase